jgi:hypothetical protein
VLGKAPRDGHGISDMLKPRTRVNAVATKESRSEDENNNITAHQNEPSKTASYSITYRPGERSHFKGMFASKHGRQQRPPDVAITADDTLFLVVGFVVPNIYEECPLCITDIRPMMRTLAQMASVCRAWNGFVLHHNSGFDKMLHRLQTRSPTEAMDGGYRLFKFVATRIGAFPNHSREWLQILGTLSASAAELMHFSQRCKDDDDPVHLMALPSGDDVRGNSDRCISLHLIGSHVIGEDYSLSGFCNDVTRRLQQHDHSAFNPNVIPTTIVHQRILGYLTLHKEAQGLDLDLGQVPLLSNNVFQWDKTLRQALTAVGREAILQVHLQGH